MSTLKDISHVENFICAWSVFSRAEGKKPEWYVREPEVFDDESQLPFPDELPFNGDPIKITRACAKHFGLTEKRVMSLWFDVYDERCEDDPDYLWTKEGKHNGLTLALLKALARARAERWARGRSRKRSRRVA